MRTYIHLKDRLKKQRRRLAYRYMFTCATGKKVYRHYRRTFKSKRHAVILSGHFIGYNLPPHIQRIRTALMAGGTIRGMVNTIQE